MEQTLLLFFSFLIEAIILLEYTSNLFVPVYSNAKRQTLLVMLYITLFAFSLFEKTWLNITIYFLINLVFLSTQFTLRFSIALFHSAILTSLMGLSELTVFGGISRFAPHFLLEAGIGLTFYTIFSKILFFAAVYLLSRFFKGSTPKQEYHSNIDFLLILIPISCIFIMFTFLSIGETLSLISPLNIMVAVSAAFLLLINLLVFGINQYNLRKNIEFTDMQLLLQKESDSALYYEMLLSQSENQNILIHDIKKHLQSIQLLNEKGDSNKINTYISQLMDSSDLKETSRICDNEILNAILCRYQRQCIDKYISFHADIRSGVLQNIYPNDLTSLFCNLLENAVEAAEDIPDSFIEITVKKKEKSPFIVIVVINSCRNIPEYNGKDFPVSHKSDPSKHGYGLKSIRKTVRQYHGNLQMYYDNNNATFHTILTLKA